MTDSHQSACADTFATLLLFSCQTEPFGVCLPCLHGCRQIPQMYPLRGCILPTTRILSRLCPARIGSGHSPCILKVYSHSFSEAPEPVLVSPALHLALELSVV